MSFLKVIKEVSINFIYDTMFNVLNNFPNYENINYIVYLFYRTCQGCQRPAPNTRGHCPAQRYSQIGFARPANRRAWTRRLRGSLVSVLVPVCLLRLLFEVVTRQRGQVIKRNDSGAFWRLHSEWCGASHRGQHRKRPSEHECSRLQDSSHRLILPRAAKGS